MGTKTLRGRFWKKNILCTKIFWKKKNWNVSILGKDLKEKVFEESVWVEKIYFGKLLLEKTEKEKKLIEKVLEKKIFGK